MPNALFVYGTLQPGQSNEHVLKNLNGKFEKATLSGFTFDRIWEQQSGYPGLIKAKPTNKVSGFLFTAVNLSKHWHILDSFETEMYQRIETSVTLEDNSKALAFVYIINSEFALSNF